MPAVAARHPLRFGVQLPLWDYAVHPEVSFASVRRTAALAEELGFDFVTVDDHLMRGEGGVFLESWTVLSMLTALTERVRFHTSVLCAVYRPPALLAKMAATLDRAGGGRLELGLGAGWKSEEAEAYGYEWPAPRGRLDRLEEAVQVIRLLWTGGPVSFDGTHYALRDAVCAPRPLQEPGPPLWIGGSGVKRTLRIAASYADGASFGNPGAAHDGHAFDHFTFFAHRRGVLAAHCEAVGRDPGELRLAVGVNLMAIGPRAGRAHRRVEQVARSAGASAHERGRAASAAASAPRSLEEVQEQVARFVALGATDVSLTRASPEAIAAFAEEVMPRFRRGVRSTVERSR